MCVGNVSHFLFCTHFSWCYICPSYVQIKNFLKSGGSITLDRDKGGLTIFYIYKLCRNGNNFLPNGDRTEGFMKISFLSNCLNKVFHLELCYFSIKERLIFQTQTKCFWTEKLDTKPLLHTCTMKSTFSILISLYMAYIHIGVIQGSIGKEDLEQYPHPYHALKLQMSIIRVGDSILSLLSFCTYMP